MPAKISLPINTSFPVPSSTEYVTSSTGKSILIPKGLLNSPCTDYQGVPSVAGRAPTALEKTQKQIIKPTYSFQP